MKRYAVYILVCSDCSYYVGVTGDLEKRILQHRHGAFPSCYTYSRRPLRLAWSQSYTDIDQAIRCEKQLKGWKRAKKAALIAGDWETLRELSRGTARQDP